jgi:hypothetical protein
MPFVCTVVGSMSKGICQVKQIKHFVPITTDRTGLQQSNKSEQKFTTYLFAFNYSTTRIERQACPIQSIQAPVYTGWHAYIRTSTDLEFLLHDKLCDE